MKKSLFALYFLIVFFTSPAFAAGNDLVRTVLCGSAWENGTTENLYAQHPEYRDICPSYIEAYKQTRQNQGATATSKSPSRQTERHKQVKGATKPKPVKKVVVPQPKQQEVVSEEKWCHGTIIINKTHPTLRGVEFCVDSSMVSDAIPWLEDNTESIVRQYNSMKEKPSRWDITPK